MSIWAINYGVGSVVGLAIMVSEWKFGCRQRLLVAVLLPVFLFSLFLRVSKALFLAADLF
jgi:hypothetical protein